MRLGIHAPVRLKAGNEIADQILDHEAATRVPASTVVRMNSASNRMAKWYQNAVSAGAAE